ncbi:lipopolysaccharide biosynthesis protein [Parabacteroides bouchesdurhonensis]|uniref:lipopolysaccharide biosynthesis protein n=1 Tax=Parabacteroides bouchesdurhonensis TaxID=1936995 RepID=UPI000E4F2A71|nr:lipopolysaccharide biosynthesis protein [Parabacteroides bouchesdurhonensis]RHJ94177.1 lipopolysaccharide biosynthesis protein [Bacteroides sp. AM07-16]
MKEQSLKHKTAQGLFWGGVSNGVQQLLSLSFGIYLARKLNADDYGLIGMLAVFTGIAGTIINSGFFTALVNKTDAKHEDYNAVFWFNFFTGLVCYVILFFCAPLIANFYEHPELKLLSRILFISFFFSGIAMVPAAILYKDLRVKTRAKIDIIALLVSGIVGVSLAYWGFSYWALAIQSLIFIVGSSIMICCVARWRPSLAVDMAPLREMLPFGSKLFFTNLFQQINNNIFPVLLGRFYSAASAGYYTQGYKWMWMARSIIAGMILSVAQPVLVKIKGDEEREINVFRKMTRFGAFVSFPCLLGLALVAGDFIQLTIGEKWLPCVPILQMLCVWAAIDTFITLYQQVLFIHERSDIYLWTNVALGISQILVAVLMLKFGIYWMVFACVLVYLGYFFLMAAYMKKLVKIHMLEILKDILPYLFITCIILAITFFITIEINQIWLRLLSRICIAGIAYAVCMKLVNSVIFKESVAFFLRRNNIY